MPVINWGIDLGDLRNEADGPRLCGCTPYGNFRIEKAAGGQIVATFTTMREGGGTFTARSPQPTWADAVVWCDRILADLRAGGTDRIRNYEVEENP